MSTMASTILLLSTSAPRKHLSTSLVHLLICLFIVLLTSEESLQLELGQCSRPLGMESGAIKDMQISASSAYDSGSVGPQHGRLRNDKNGGAWCPRQMVSRDAKEYLEINMDDLHVVTGVRTQGRFGNGQGQEYAEEYMIEYWRPGFVKWTRWKNRESKELLSGNTNTYTVVEQKLEPPVIATKIRLLPYSDHVRTVCMRVELVGCKSTDGLISYAGPQGLKRGPEMDLSDRTYDGKEEGGMLTYGLGQLVDGRKGQDNFRLDTGHGKAYEWVGWRNDTAGWAGHPLELVFEFDKVRNFSAAHLHTNNLFTKDVQVFSHAKIFISIGGNVYNGEPVHFSYMPDLVLEHARNVTIKLHNRIGKFIKLQLYFASRWILLSEISFDSVVVSGNYTTGEEDTIPESEYNIPDHNYVGEHTQYKDDDQDQGREYPLQRDEVKTISAKTNFNRHPGGSASGSNADAAGSGNETKPYIGFVIGVLTVVILLLVGAIVFIVFRNQRIKLNATRSATIQRDDIKRYDADHKMDECDKAVLYQESLRPIYTASQPQAQQYPQQQQQIREHRLSQHHPHSPDYTVPDVICQDYATPHMGRDFTSTSIHATPSIHSFLPKAPPIPPPPSGYYATDDIRDNLNMESPPLTPSDSLRSKLSRHFLLPLSPDHQQPMLLPKLEDVVVEMVPYDQLQIIEKLGESRFGDYHLCKMQKAYEDPKLVVVHSLRVEALAKEFDTEVRSLARLKDPNIAQLLGGRLDSQPICAVREYYEMGDLCQFLQEHVAETTTPLTSGANTLSYGCLVYMATQIASGMKCLENYRYVHRDLATRNCLVNPRYQIKISDLGAYREAYAHDYCQIASGVVGGVPIDGGRRPMPLRWMAWESVLLGKYTMKSDVWSFAVTLWEILTFAREQPFEDLSDEKVIENVTHFYQDNGKHMLLSVPINCPKEIFDLMCECWQRNESDRPNFREIHLFLQRKNLGYTPDLH
ncbi:discoidin domain-containing receptor tyrosine kinase B isoform X2 [Atheta coriaria]|uniref:discoidin domain-containing receptor tyrosine kinase B isoform X2 n=1 Tax=Dalotia coriaria TaxID=877792 RepID=UPI0031F41B26